MDAWSTVLGNETMHIICSCLPDIAKALNRKQKSVEIPAETAGEIIGKELENGWRFKACIPVKEGHVVIIFEK